jgi:cytoskeletal protein CcmA (bactofilin family)
MFKRSKSMAKQTELEGTRNHISAGTTISGDIETSGDIRLDGKLIGTINSNGKVVIGEGGKLEGEIICTNANISGTVQGKISVKELLSLQTTANINGDIETGKLSIEPGANFTGACSMGATVKDINHVSGNQKGKTA